jgi:HSP20 family protein
MSIGKTSNFFNPSFLELWNPFNGPPFNSSLLTSPRSSSSPSDTYAYALVRIDWKETPEAHVLKADLPGLKKEEVKVEIEDGNILQISGEHTREKENKTDTWHCLERSCGKYLRRFRLPMNANLDQIMASMENGVLTVTVPKEKVKKPVVKSVAVSG